METTIKNTKQVGVMDANRTEFLSICEDFLAHWDNAEQDLRDKNLDAGYISENYKKLEEVYHFAKNDVNDYSEINLNSVRLMLKETEEHIICELDN